MIEELADVLGNTLEHAKIKHARTTGVLKKTHASLKKALKVETGKRRSMRHQYVNIAVLNYKCPSTRALGANVVVGSTNVFRIKSFF